MKKAIPVSLLTGAMTLTIALAGPAHASAPASAPDQSSASCASISLDEAAKSTELAPRERQLLEELKTILPANWEEQQRAAQQRLGLTQSPFQDALLARAAQELNPDDYQCGPTKFTKYLDSILKDLPMGIVFMLGVTGAIQVPTYDTLFAGNEGDPAYALPEAEEDLITDAFEFSSRVWDVKLDDVQMLGMNSSAMKDPARIKRALMLGVGIPEKQAENFTGFIVKALAEYPQLEGGDHPLFTLNAWAFSADAFPDPNSDDLPDKVAIGDGIIEAVRILGYGDPGVQFVVAHEVAHQVQFEAWLLRFPFTTADQTRHAELMADAFGSYSAVHKKGIGMSALQLMKASDTAYATGDCGFSGVGHHGTPNQRRAASAWGIATAASGDNDARTLSVKQIARQFNEAYPEIVAPDAIQLIPEGWEAAVRAAA